MNIKINEKDIEMDLFSGTGAGGQNRNKCQKCVRIRHIPTGIVVTGQRQRSLEGNKRQAMDELLRRLIVLNTVDAERIDTKIPAFIVARRIQDKRMQGDKKSFRSNHYE